VELRPLDVTLSTHYYCGRLAHSERLGNKVLEKEYRVNHRTRPLSAAVIVRDLGHHDCSKWWCVETRVAAWRKYRIHRRVLCTDQQWRKQISCRPCLGESYLRRSYVMTIINNPCLLSISYKEGMNRHSYLASTNHDHSLLSYIRRGDVVNVHSMPKKAQQEALESGSARGLSFLKVVGPSIANLNLPKVQQSPPIVRQDDMIVPPAKLG